MYSTLGAFPWLEGGSRTVREKHKTSDDVCQARQGGGVFPACLAARSISVARRSYLSAGLYLLVRVSIPGPVRGRGAWWMGASLSRVALSEDSGRSFEVLSVVH